MKKTIKSSIVAILVLAMMLSTCVIAPLSVSAAKYLSTDWSINENAAAADAIYVSDGDLENGYEINTSMGYFTRLNEKVDPLKGVTFKAESGVNYWYAVIFEGENTGEIGYSEQTYTKQTFLLRPQADGSLTVRYFSGTAELTMFTLADFDMSVPHTYHYRKDPDAYRFCIDGVAVCEGAAIAVADEGMTAAATNGGYFSVGSENVAKMLGFRVKGYNWTTTDGSSVDGNMKDGYSASTAAGNYARLNKQIDLGAGISFQYIPATLGNWVQLNFSATNDVLGLSGNSTNIFLRADSMDENGIGTLRLCRFNGGEATIGSIEGFDYTKAHTFRLVKCADGYYRLNVDNNRFWTGFLITYDEFNAANNNGAGAYVTLGGEGAATFTNIKPALWAASYNVDIDGDLENGYTVTSNENNCYARFNKKIDLTQGFTFKFKPVSGSDLCQLNFSSTPDTAFGLVQTMTNFFFRGADIDENGIGRFVVSSYSPAYPDNNHVNIEGFDFNAEHVMKYVRGEDNVYRLSIDGRTLEPSISINDMDVVNNYGEGAYLTFGGRDMTYTLSVKPVTTEAAPWTAGNYTVNENGGYDVSNTTNIRYNNAIDMTKGVMFKLSYTGAWAGITFEGSKKTTIGGLNTGSDLKMYVTNLETTADGVQYFRTNIWDGGNAVGTTDVDLDHTGYVHIQYKLNAEGTHYYLNVNGKTAFNADAISVEAWKTSFNNGNMYISFTPWGGAVTVTDFKAYSAPAIATNYSVEDDIIYGVAADTDVADLGVEANGGEVRVYNAEGVRVESGNVGTGMTVCDYINTNDKSSEYIISVSGDMDGDGAISGVDVVALRKELMAEEGLTVPVFKAADMNNDNELDILDLIKIKTASLE